MTKPATTKRHRLSRTTAARFWSVAATACVLVSVRQAHAEPTWLEWDPPPECADKAHIEARVVEWLGGPISEETDLEVVSRVTWKDQKWEVTVDVRLDGAEGRRKIAVQRCSDAADFVALAVVLAVDPSVVGEDEAAFLASQDAAEGEATDSEVTPEREGEEEPIAPEPDEEEPTSAAAQELSPAPRKKRPLTFFAQAGAELDTSALPSPALGMSLGGGLGLGHARLGLGGRWIPSREVSLSGADGPIKFGLLASRLSACWVERVRSVELVPCLTGEAGRMRTREATAELPITTNEFWAATGLGVSAGWRVLSWMAPYLGADLQIPITQPNFVLSNGNSVHRPGVGVVGTAGLRFFFGSE